MLLVYYTVNYQQTLAYFDPFIVNLVHCFHSLTGIFYIKKN